MLVNAGLVTGKQLQHMFDTEVTIFMMKRVNTENVPELPSECNEVCKAKNSGRNTESFWCSKGLHVVRDGIGPCIHCGEM